MVFIGRCIPCQFGKHEEHYEVIQAVPEGVIGGAICGCEGECVEDYRTRNRSKVERDVAVIMEAYDDLEALDDFLAPYDDPEEG